MSDDIANWKHLAMQDMLEEIKGLHEQMKVIYAACGASCGNSVHMHRCLLAIEPHAHVCDDCGFVWDAIPQVPEWRAMVDEAKRELAGSALLAGDPLANVLSSLSNIASGVCEVEGNLTGIIAICESQVGGGWQAEPDAAIHAKDTSGCNVWCLIYALGFTERWRVLGNRAAAWLRDLTGEAT